MYIFIFIEISTKSYYTSTRLYCDLLVYYSCLDFHDILSTANRQTGSFVMIYDEYSKDHACLHAVYIQSDTIIIIRAQRVNHKNNNYVFQSS